MVSDTGPLLAGRYQLQRLVAQGGRGDVWLGTDTALARPVAVKVIRAECAADDAAVDLLRRAAQRAGSLAHENVARIYDFDEDGDSHLTYLVMEYADGPSLDQLVANGPLAPASAMAVIAQIAAGLAHVHGHDLAHGAVEPRNVLVSRQGQVKLIGLGSGQPAPRLAPCDATASAGAGSGADGSAGTPAAAEAAVVTGTAADVHGLGLIARLCLTGSAPSDGADKRTPAGPGGRRAEADQDIAAFVAALTATDGGRPASAAEIAKRAGQLRDRLAGEAAGARGTQAARPGDWQPAVVPVPTVGPAFRPASALTGATVAAPALSPLHRPRWRLATATLCSFAVVGLMVGAAGLLGHHPARAVAPPARTVLVDGAALRDKPVGVVRLRLSKLGLRVHVDWRATDAVKPGLVISVRPAGRVAVGSLVTVFGARPSAQAGGYAGKSGTTSGHKRAKSRAHPNPSATGNSAPTVAPGPTTGPPANPTPAPTGSPAPTDPPSSPPPGSPPPSGSPSPTGGTDAS
jgi:eukaryotic-like serine/threonine-protein kinase